VRKGASVLLHLLPHACGRRTEPAIRRTREGADVRETREMSNAGNRDLASTEVFPRHVASQTVEKRAEARALV
jgi:hypothetical protein